MSARDHVLLTEAERTALFGIPVEPDELARRYTLEKADLDLINQRRLDRNRLGVALQVALLRHPGMPLAQVLQIGGAAPTPLVAFLARQLGLSPAVLADYATRTQTMTDHGVVRLTKGGSRGVRSAARLPGIFDADDIAPDLESDIARSTMLGRSQAMAAELEVVVDPAVGGEEALRVSG